ncbi:ISLre2 family transposase [Thermoanaerobacterium thermosaccharolyticum]|uniref:ISLre2 family transposase n=1 Tax=Thermoanaerobacterium thermosaccharolyticum TaxID=1517 RepID=UPI003DA7C704
MLNNSLSENAIDFKTLEQEVYYAVLELGRSMMKAILEAIDEELMKSRDKEKYRHRGKKKTCIKTLMDPVEFSRIIYEYKDENGKKCYVYLLDEYLKMETIGFMSVNLLEKIIESVSNVSYRKAAENITELTGQDISHAAVWNIVQELGKRIIKQEQEKVKAYQESKLEGKKEVKVLFEEVDGLWINMQGKDRKGRNGKKQEIKLAVTYEGWKKRNPGRDDEYVVINKRAVAGFMEPEEFADLLEATINEEYDTEKIEVRVLNGDGAKWIRKCADIAPMHYQLDRFHVFKAIIRQVYDKREAKKILRLIKGGNVEKALVCIEELKYKCGGEHDKVKKLKQLEEYLRSNFDGLIIYHKRNNVELPEPPEGIYYRNLGTMEHQICDILSLRMKGGKMSWSKAGANNISKILALKASGKLYDTIQSLMSSVASERLLKKYKEVIEAAKKKVDEVKKKLPKVYTMRRGQIPYSGCAMTEGRKAIRDLVSYRRLEDMI